ncbi:MAG TPA: hypothetical protein VFK05_03990 [Polyangiaceae bacterium]|nr:hypothetical protein [Polyangiaceae bacterium]
MQLEQIQNPVLSLSKRRYVAALAAVLGGVLTAKIANAQPMSAGAASSQPMCVAVEALVSDGYSGPGPGPAKGEVLRVNPVGQSVLTNNMSPTGGPDLDQPTDMAFLPNGDIVVTDSGAFTGLPKVVEVNPNTGARTLLSGLSSLSSPARGSGPALVWPFSVAIEAGGDILVVDQNPTTYAPRILRIDPTTGNRIVLSGNGVGSGPTLTNAAPAEVANLGGVIYLANGGQLMSVSPSNGNRTLISGGSRGTGPSIVWPLSIANGSTTNTLMVLDERQPSAVPGRPLGALISVDLATGDRTVFSSNGAPNGGQQFDGPYDMAYDACQNVYYVLEPGYSPALPPGRVLEVDGVTGVRSLYANYLGARNWSLLMTPLLNLPGGGTGGGGSGPSGGCGLDICDDG